MEREAVKVSNFCKGGKLGDSLGVDRKVWVKGAVIDEQQLLNE